MAPKVVTATDEQDLAKQLERAEQENAEVSFSFIYFDHAKTFTSLLLQVSGDDDDEDEEQVGMGGKISEGEESNEEEED